MDVEKED